MDYSSGFILNDETYLFFADKSFFTRLLTMKGEKMKEYLTDSNEVLKSLNTGEEGLSSAEAEKRLEANGKNKLVEAKKETLLMRFVKQLIEPMTIILIIAAIISAIVEAPFLCVQLTVRNTINTTA